MLFAEVTPPSTEVLTWYNAAIALFVGIVVPLGGGIMVLLRHLSKQRQVEREFQSRLQMAERKHQVETAEKEREFQASLKRDEVAALVEQRTRERELYVLLLRGIEMVGVKIDGLGGKVDNQTDRINARLDMQTLSVSSGLSAVREAVKAKKSVEEDKPKN